MTSEPTTLSAMLETAPERPAVICADDGERISYGELAGRVEALAGRLRAAGVERGDRVALVLPNGPEFVEALLAIGALGAGAAPLNPGYTADEHSFYLDDLAPRVLLLAAGETPAAREVVPDAIPVVELSYAAGAGSSLALGGRDLAPAALGEAASPDDVALLLHTSGTTSRPKQVPLLHRNLAASARNIAAFYGLGPDDVSYCAMPLFHVHGLVASTLATLASGGSVVVTRRLAPRRFWQHLGEHGVTWFSAGPTLHHMLLDKAEDAAIPPTLRFTRSCSSALSPALFARAEERYGVPILEAYGMTEASHQMASNPLPPARREVGSVGIASGVEIGIADRDGRFLGVGEAGEVCIKGPGVTPGYLGNPEANASSFFDGWFRTGDQGVVDADGYLRLVGRIKEMILRGGENISPLEIEEILLAHPAVADAVAFGVADEKYGEEVEAAVALKGEATDRDLVDHCKERLAAFKVPRRIHVLEAIPRTPTGKVQRRRMPAHLYGEQA